MTKNIQLTPTQGVLSVVGVLVLFGGIWFWNNSRSARSYSGTVKAAGSTLVPFGCHSEGNQLFVSLRPEPQPSGLHEENRAIIFQHNITERNTNQPIPAKVVAVSWRDQSKNVSSITCNALDDQLTTWLKRRGGQRVIRDDFWTGTVKATCTVPGFGETTVDLQLENCGF